MTKDMEKKYKFTEETKSIYFGRTLHRIVAVRDFGCVKEELGEGRGHG